MKVGDVMARDGVANFVSRMHECKFDPRKVGPDAWESRCPAWRSADHALSITRNEHDQAVLECRSRHNCSHFRILGAVGWTDEYLYAEIPEGLISRMGRIAIEPPSLKSPETREKTEISPTPAQTQMARTEPRRHTTQLRSRMRPPHARTARKRRLHRSRWWVPTATVRPRVRPGSPPHCRLRKKAPSAR
jgi:hypothetical protein